MLSSNQYEYSIPTRHRKSATIPINWKMVSKHSLAALFVPAFLAMLRNVSPYRTIFPPSKTSNRFLVVGSAGTFVPELRPSSSRNVRANKRRRDLLRLAAIIIARLRTRTSQEPWFQFFWPATEREAAKTEAATERTTLVARIAR